MTHFTCTVALTMTMKLGEDSRGRKDFLLGRLLPFILEWKWETGRPYHGSLSDRAKTVDEDVAGHIHRCAYG